MKGLEMKVDLKIFLSGMIFACFLVFSIYFGIISKPLTPEEQTERQKQKNASTMTIFEDSVFLKHPKTGECLEVFFKKDSGETEIINNLMAVRPCNCEKVPSELLITAEISKKP